MITTIERKNLIILNNLYNEIGEKGIFANYSDLVPRYNGDTFRILLDNKIILWEGSKIKWVSIKPNVYMVRKILKLKIETRNKRQLIKNNKELKLYNNLDTYNGYKIYKISQIAEETNKTIRTIQNYCKSLKLKKVNNIYIIYNDDYEKIKDHFIDKEKNVNNIKNFQKNASLNKNKIIPIKDCGKLKENEKFNNIKIKIFGLTIFEKIIN